LTAHRRQDLDLLTLHEFAQVICDKAAAAGDEDRPLSDDRKNGRPLRKGPGRPPLTTRRAQACLYSSPIRSAAIKASCGICTAKAQAGRR